MPKTNKASPAEKYDALFATTLRRFMDGHPDTGAKTTQKALAEHLNVRPQTVSCYCTGESLPNCEQLLKIAEFFNVTADFMITGRRAENKPVRDILGLSEKTVQNLRLVKEGYFEDCPQMLPALDCLLGSKDFYLGIEKALEWYVKKPGKDIDYQMFCEWKAARFMESFLLDFFSSNLEAIYRERKGGE